MFIAIAIFIVSLLVLIKSADIFTDNVELLGRKFNIPTFILGVTVVAVGTSIPELASSLVAVSTASEIVLGDVIGSNVVNILLIIGLSTLFLKKETKITWDLYHGDITFLIASTIMLGVILLDGYVSIIEAVLLLVGYLLYVLYNVDLNNKNDNENKNDKLKFNYINILQLIICLGLILVSADSLVKSAVDLSKLLNIGTDVIALTLIAVGTSLPELMVSFIAARKGNIELAIGNIIGSNIFNALGIVGISRFLGELKITEAIFPQTYLFLLIAVALFISIILDKKLHRFEGAVLLLFFILFVLSFF